MQIQISWLLQKPTDLDLHCLLRQGMSCSAREGLRGMDIHSVISFSKGANAMRKKSAPLRANAFLIEKTPFQKRTGPSCSLTGSLVVKMLTVLVSTISNAEVFLLKNVSSFCKCKSYSHFFSKTSCIYAMFNPYLAGKK